MKSAPLLTTLLLVGLFSGPALAAPPPEEAQNPENAEETEGPPSTEAPVDPDDPGTTDGTSAASDGAVAGSGDETETETEAETEAETPPEETDDGPEETDATPVPTGLTGVAAAPPLVPRHRIVYTNLLAARINPLGLEERLWLGYQYRLYDKRGALWEQSNLAVLFNPIISPAIARIGTTFQVQPLTILRLRATPSFYAWYGTFQYMQSYTSPYADFSPQQLDEGKCDKDASSQIRDGCAPRNYATTGWQMELQALLQLKVGPIAVRSEATFQYNDMKLKPGTDDVYYDVRIDALVPDQGWAMFNDADVLYVSNFGLIAGVRNTTTHAFFPKGVFESSDPNREDPNGTLNRVGPLLAYSFFDKPEKRFNKPTILAIAQWHTHHPWRTGEDVTQADRYTIRDPIDDEPGPITRGVTQAFPTIVLGFAFSGDIWGSTPK